MLKERRILCERRQLHYKSWNHPFQQLLLLNDSQNDYLVYSQTGFHFLILRMLAIMFSCGFVHVCAWDHGSDELVFCFGRTS